MRTVKVRLSAVPLDVRHDETVIRVVLFDLDGVVRHFDPSHVTEIESRHGIPRGALEAIAFSRPNIDDVTTGQISRAQWIDRIAHDVGSPEAADEWGRQPFTVDPEILRLADELRQAGLTTAILTNGTDTIPTETAQLGLDSHFSHIFNSASIGFVKPDQRAFQFVLDTLDVPGGSVFFTDDSAAKLEGAVSLGMTTHHYESVAGLRDALRRIRVPIGQ